MSVDGSAPVVVVPKLERVQRRIIGVLIEKALTTPDQYPLTRNAVQTGSNQKTAREPLMELSAEDVDLTLLKLKDLGLVTRVMPATGRVDRWKHNLKDLWSLDRAQRAVIGELLLRGPQSEGDLRGRASRMMAPETEAELESLEKLRTILDELARRGFVRRLSPDGQKRGVFWTHEFFPESEWAKLESRIGSSFTATDDEPAAPSPPPAPVVRQAPLPTAPAVSMQSETPTLRSSISDDDWRQLRDEVRSLADLRLEVRRLNEEVELLRSTIEDIEHRIRPGGG